MSTGKKPRAYSIVPTNVSEEEEIIEKEIIRSDLNIKKKRYALVIVIGIATTFLVYFLFVGLVVALLLTFFFYECDLKPNLFVGLPQLFERTVTKLTIHDFTETQQTYIYITNIRPQFDPGSDPDFDDDKIYVKIQHPYLLKSMDKFSVLDSITLVEGGSHLKIVLKKDDNFYLSCIQSVVSIYIPSIMPAIQYHIITSDKTSVIFQGSKYDRLNVRNLTVDSTDFLDSQFSYTNITEEFNYSSGSGDIELSNSLLNKVHIAVVVDSPIILKDLELTGSLYVDSTQGYLNAENVISHNNNINLILDAGVVIVKNMSASGLIIQMGSGHCIATNIDVSQFLTVNSKEGMIAVEMHPDVSSYFIATSVEGLLLVDNFERIRYSIAEETFLAGHLNSELTDDFTAYIALVSFSGDICLHGGVNISYSDPRPPPNAIPDSCKLFECNDFACNSGLTLASNIIFSLVLMTLLYI